MMKKTMIALALLASPALAENAAMMAPPGGAYQAVSDLVELPEFIPGLGSVYVDPTTLPVGPFAAYDRTGHLVSTVYMVPLAAMNAHEQFKALGVAGTEVNSVDIYYNAGHPGVAEPHYHITLWHVTPASAELE